MFRRDEGILIYRLMMVSCSLRERSLREKQIFVPCIFKAVKLDVLAGGGRLWG